SRDGYRPTGADVKHAAVAVAIQCEACSAGTGNGDDLVHQQFATRQPNRASYRKGNRVMVIRVRERLTQRAGAAVVCISDGYRRRVHWNCDCTEQQHAKRKRCYPPHCAVYIILSFLWGRKRKDNLKTVRAPSTDFYPYPGDATKQ